MWNARWCFSNDFATKVLFKQAFCHEFIVREKNSLENFLTYL